MALTDDGKVYMWGIIPKPNQTDVRNIDHSACIQTPTILDMKGFIVDIFSGFHHCFGKTDKGKLMAYGRNEIGQCGLGDRYTREHPEEVKAFEDVNGIDIAVGGFHTLALSDYKVYVWGMDDFGQLGLGYTDGIARPIVVKRLAHERVIAIAAGAKHSVALTESGDVYAWGYHNNGQIGMKSPVKAMTRTIDGLATKKAVRIFSSAFAHHNFVQVDNGAIFAFGLDNAGQCGIQTDSQHFEATFVPFLTSRRPYKLVLGFSVTYAFSRNITEPLHGLLSNHSFIDTYIHCILS
jgi:alpha-tubulin suppressor-like RCC1 family protein